MLTGQIIFARHKDGYYYPATINSAFGSLIKVSFLNSPNGDMQEISKSDTIELQDALKTLNLESNWENAGFFIKGTITSQHPLTILYDDKMEEKIELNQLRGTKLGDIVQEQDLSLKKVISVLYEGLLSSIAREYEEDNNAEDIKKIEQEFKYASTLYVKQSALSWTFAIARDRLAVRKADGIDCYTIEGIGTIKSVNGKQLQVYDINGHKVAHIKQKHLWSVLSWMKGRNDSQLSIEINETEVCKIIRKKGIFKNSIEYVGLPWQHKRGWIDTYEIKDNNNKIVMQVKCNSYTTWSWGDCFEINIANPKQELLCLCVALALWC